jgi:pyruvate/2-oxoglutarate dehydrogenase complex dihydrolipoamide dehydrogenase (E3) component
MDRIETDICVIGAGAGGLSVASGAAQLGRRVVLIEKGEMGGDCLNVGCVPSKALIAAARAAEAQRSGARFGIAPVEPKIDGSGVYAHIKSVIDEIAPYDSQARFESLGVRVIRAAARFLDARTVEAGNQRVRARRFVLATGSSPVVPQIPGLDTVPYLTNETIFELRAVPERLIIIGGGSTGIELAQAYRRLGAQVIVVDAQRMLARYERGLAQLVLDQLQREGIILREGAKIHEIEPRGRNIRLRFARLQGEEIVEGSHILIAAGRKPNIASLDLEKAKIATGAGGIKVDDRLKTSNPRVYAVGDVTGARPFTHVASYHAALVIRNLLFKLRAHSSYDAVPEVLYTDPEFAKVGLSEEEAKKRRVLYDVVDSRIDETDRGKTDGISKSAVRVTLGRGGRILGASIVAPNAGEIILPWVMAVSQRLKLSQVANFVVPYPTLGDHMKRVAAGYYAPTLFGRRARLLAGLLSRFG